MKLIKEHYSGKISKEFWCLVKKIKSESDHQEIYSLGVALQNMENYVLMRLKDCVDK